MQVSRFRTRAEDVEGLGCRVFGCCVLDLGTRGVG